jgi:GT2 family glycosyltransferase
MSILFVITTANQLKYTQMTLDSLRKTSIYSKMDILLIDDASEDGTQDYCKENNINYISKDEAMGLTHSWNLGYAAFVKGNYDYLIYANNDILIPDGAIDELLKSARDNIAVGSMSTLRGVGFQPLQAVEEHYTLPIDATDPKNYQKVQEFILKENGIPNEKEIPDHINGFFFCLNKDIKKYQIADDILFDPISINIKNETELCRKIKEPKMLCTRSFIFHFKGVSFKSYGANLDNLFLDRDLSWKEVEQLKRKYFGVLYAYYFLSFYINKIRRALKLRHRLKMLLRR